MVKRVLIFAFACSSLSYSQQTNNLAGTYVGSLAQQNVLVRFASTASGLSCTAESPGLHLLESPCANLSLNGQSLSFTVPSVRGSWVGFISDDGLRLTGTWNQGAPIPLNLSRNDAGGNSPPVAPQPYPVNRQMQAPGGNIAPVSMAQAAVPSCGIGPHATGDLQPAGTVAFDDPAKVVTVSRPDGFVIRFDDRETRITCGPVVYQLRHSKGSGMKMFGNSILHPKNNGGSITGAGVEFLINGTLEYDSGAGHYGDMNTNPRLRQAKIISVIAVAAVADIRRTPGHESFTPPGYSDIAEIAQYKLTSDGSR